MEKRIESKLYLVAFANTHELLTQVGFPFQAAFSKCQTTKKIPRKPSPLAPPTKKNSSYIPPNKKLAPASTKTSPEEVLMTESCGNWMEINARPGFFGCFLKGSSNSGIQLGQKNGKTAGFIVSEISTLQLMSIWVTKSGWAKQLNPSCLQWQEIHPGKLTWILKMMDWKMYISLFKYAYKFGGQN